MKKSLALIRFNVGKARRKLLSNRRLSRGLLVLGGVAVVVLLLSRFFLSTTPSVIDFSRRVILNQPVWSLKNDNGRTNILLLGIGGGSHDGPDLTDTMIVVSVVTKFEKDDLRVPPVYLISIPRDIYLDSLQEKINAAYDIGLSKGAGLALAKTAASEVTGLPIHYAAEVDFSAFEKIIDLLGGIDVNVASTLDDYQYPISGKENDTCGLSPEEATAKAATIVDDATALAAFPCRYERLHFDAGPQHMNGTTTLKFVRSRHAEGPEGTDFARSRRQQLVIEAIKEKVFSTQGLLNPIRDLEIYNELKSHIDTDFDLSQPNELLKLALRYNKAKLQTVPFDLNLLENPPVDSQRGWILLPKAGNWDEVRQFIRSSLETNLASQSGQSQQQ